MNKYQNGKIYKLVDENDDWYIGSTIQPLTERLRLHNKDMDCMSRHLINPTIHLIEDYPCSNQRELEMREQYYLNKYRDRCINFKNAYQTPEERKQYHKEYNDKYREENKEILNEKAREKGNKKIECECGSIVSYGNLTRHRKTKSHQKKINEININGKTTTSIPADREC